MKYLISLVTGVLLLTQVAFANNYSYVYIEGDKQTPFYVKMEGQMLPRLGKNYAIIPNLDAGVTYIEILFQQNKYAAQKFAVKIPVGGSRGFLLQKVNDRQFALYDMQQGTYLVSGNKPEEDQLPAVQEQSAVSASVTETATAAKGNEDDIPAFTAPKKNRQPKQERPNKETPVPEEAPADNRFIGDMELNTNNPQQATTRTGARSERPVPAKKKAKPARNEEKTLAAITNEDDEDLAPVPSKVEPVENSMANTDCKAAMSSEEFEEFAIKILDKTEDADRIKVLTKGKGKKCFSTEQVRIIANNLDTQSGRYDVVKLLYPQTADQANYPQLESLFKTNYLRNKFKEIVAPK